jgi:hypothetical protein
MAACFFGLGGWCHLALDPGPSIQPSSFSSFARLLPWGQYADLASYQETWKEKEEEDESKERCPNSCKEAARW